MEQRPNLQISTEIGPRSGLQLIFAFAFAVSGFAALAYQIAWQRVLTQVIGSDAISAVLTVSIFMIWLGVGAEIARRILPFLRGRAGLAYAVIETVIGIAGIASIPLLRAANESLATAGASSLAADVGLNLLLLAVPVIGMGMTTPLIVEVAKHELADLGRTVGRFYGLNILGAAAGALATGLVLIELLGLLGVTVLAACLNFCVGLAVLMALRSHTSTTSEDMFTNSRSFDNTAHEKPSDIALAAVLFGFGTLALQIIFFRVLSNYFTLSVIVFPAVLCAYLLLMSAGQVVGGRLADSFADKLPAVVGGLFAAGSLLLVAALRFPPSWAADLGALAFTSFSGQLISETHPNLIGDPSPLTVLAFSMPFMLAVLAWAALFPVMLRLMTRNVREASSRFASLYTLYTVGNVLGALVTGLYFFEWLGTGGTAAATILITGIGALVVVRREGAVRGSPLLLTAASIAIAVTLTPWDYYKTFNLGAYRVAEVYEGRTGVASVVPAGRFYTIVDMNRTASASAIIAEPGPADAYEAWRWNHTELFALDPNFRPKRILIIGIGHAYLIDALLDLPFIQEITIVDLSREIVDAVRTHTTTTTRRIFTDPRVKIIIADGRRFVQKARARGERYDLIQTKINEPWHAGSGNLFTVEFFKSQKDLLAPGGYLGTRPLLGHAVDGIEVFGAAIWPGYYHLFFKNGPLSVPDVAKVTPDIKLAWRTSVPGRPDPSSSRAAFLEVLILPCCGLQKSVQNNTDDLPAFEYDWIARSIDSTPSPRKNLGDLNLPKRRVPVVFQE